MQSSLDAEVKGVGGLSLDAVPGIRVLHLTLYNTVDLLMYGFYSMFKRIGIRGKQSDSR